MGKHSSFAQGNVFVNIEVRICVQNAIQSLVLVLYILNGWTVNEEKHVGSVVTNVLMRIGISTYVIHVVQRLRDVTITVFGVAIDRDIVVLLVSKIIAITVIRLLACFVVWQINTNKQILSFNSIIFKFGR